MHTQEQLKEDACYTHVIENILNDQCPGCSQVHSNFQACTALMCANAACGTYFCANCLVDYGKGLAGFKAAHAHIVACKFGPPVDNGKPMNGTHVRMEKLEKLRYGHKYCEAGYGLVARLTPNLRALGILD
ncbi:hypothetical protein T492DRAFT_831427 [Pavlovales sp. CCMP2436]|nr:hypothetical protein T492DRAFT_831427 [Pavlovales sp. CCMP2436]